MCTSMNVNGIIGESGGKINIVNYKTSNFDLKELGIFNENKYFCLIWYVKHIKHLYSSLL